jgi:hypothetical protein
MSFARIMQYDDAVEITFAVRDRFDWIDAMLSVFCSPSRYMQGGGRPPRGRDMAALELEDPVLIIAGKTVVSRLAETWQSSLNDAKMPFSQAIIECDHF